MPRHRRLGLRGVGSDAVTVERDDERCWVAVVTTDERSLTETARLTTLAAASLHPVPGWLPTDQLRTRGVAVGELGYLLTHDQVSSATPAAQRPVTDWTRKIVVGLRASLDNHNAKCPVPASAFLLHPTDHGLLDMKTLWGIPIQADDRVPVKRMRLRCPATAADIEDEIAEHLSES